MSEPDYLTTAQGRRIAYHMTDGRAPMVVFIHGLKSDMDGTKAVYLEDWARARKHGFLRFDCSGHGLSSGEFTDGCIGDWAADAAAVLEGLTEGPVLLVGSSMGGWLSLLLARKMPERIAGLVTIAAAPDFTEDGFWDGFSDAEKAALERDGQVAMPSDYDEPYIITKRLIEDGRDHLVLRDPLSLPFPVRFLQGTEDEAVPTEKAVRLLQHATGNDMRLTLLKGKDHRFSDPESLRVMERAVEDVLTRWKG